MSEFPEGRKVPTVCVKFLALSDCRRSRLAGTDVAATPGESGVANNAASEVSKSASLGASAVTQPEDALGLRRAGELPPLGGVGVGGSLSSSPSAVLQRVANDISLPSTVLRLVDGADAISLPADNIAIIEALSSNLGSSADSLAAFVFARSLIEPWRLMEPWRLNLGFAPVSLMVQLWRESSFGDGQRRTATTTGKRADDRQASDASQRVTSDASQRKTPPSVVVLFSDKTQELSSATEASDDDTGGMSTSHTTACGSGALAPGRTSGGGRNCRDPEFRYNVRHI